VDSPAPWTAEGEEAKGMCGGLGRSLTHGHGVAKEVERCANRAQELENETLKRRDAVALGRKKVTTKKSVEEYWAE
jgi:hypothetical protein